MFNNIETIVLAFIFVILLVVIFKPIKSAFNLDTFPSCVLSVCVSGLCIIGMSRSLKGSMEAVLLPYAALGIAILLILLFLFIGKHFKGAKDCLSDYDIRKDDAVQTRNSSRQRAEAFGVRETRDKLSGAPETRNSTRVPKQFLSRVNPEAPVRSGHLRTKRKNRTNKKRLKR